MSKSKPECQAPTTGSKPRRSFTEEFKKEAVRLAIERGNVSAVARDLGVSESMLDRWKRSWLAKQNTLNLKAFPRRSVKTRQGHYREGREPLKSTPSQVLRTSMW